MKEIKISPSITPRESENLSRYFMDIRTSCPLDPEQEANLAVLIQHGDIAARHKLVEANLRCVISVAKQYQNAGVPLDDLINEGNMGLIKAAERFDPTRGFKFASFAVWWIRQAILLFLSDKGRMVRLPQNIENVLSRIRNAENAFEQQFQRPPSSEELAERLDMPAQKIEEYLGHVNSTVSLDAPLSSDSDTTIGETLNDTSAEATDKSLLADSLRHDLQIVIQSLHPREQQIIRLYYGLDGEQQSMDMIAMELHLSRERIRQLLDNGIDKIRKQHGQALKKYA